MRTTTQTDNEVLVFIPHHPAHIIIFTIQKYIDSVFFLLAATVSHARLMFHNVYIVRNSHQACFINKQLTSLQATTTNKRRG